MIYIKKIFVALFYFLFNIGIFSLISHITKDSDIFILSFLVVEVIFCEILLRKNHQELLDNIRHGTVCLPLIFSYFINSFKTVILFIMFVIFPYAMYVTILKRRSEE